MDSDDELAFERRQELLDRRRRALQGPVIFTYSSSQGVQAAQLFGERSLPQTFMHEERWCDSELSVVFTYSSPQGKQAAQLGEHRQCMLAGTRFPRHIQIQGHDHTARTLLDNRYLITMLRATCQIGGAVAATGGDDLVGGPADNPFGLDLLNLQLGLVDRDFDESDYEVGLLLVFIGVTRLHMVWRRSCPCAPWRCRTVKHVLVAWKTCPTCLGCLAVEAFAPLLADAAGTGSGWRRPGDAHLGGAAVGAAVFCLEQRHKAGELLPLLPWCIERFGLSALLHVHVQQYISCTAMQQCRWHYTCCICRQ